MGCSYFLCSHSKVVFPKGTILCPPKATSLTLDLTNGALLTMSNIVFDITLHCAPVSILKDNLRQFTANCTCQSFLFLSPQIVSTSKSLSLSLSSSSIV